jgi:hypothetical protein
MTAPVPGCCRYCTCTEDRACRIPPYGEDDTCGWLHGTDRTVCTAPPCLRRWEQAKRVQKLIKERRSRRLLNRWLAR